MHFGWKGLILSPSVPKCTHGNLSYTVQNAWSNYTAWNIFNSCHRKDIRNSSSPKLCEVYNYWAFTPSLNIQEKWICIVLLHPHFIPLDPKALKYIWSPSLLIPKSQISSFPLTFIYIWKTFFLVRWNTNTGAAELRILYRGKGEMLTSMQLDRSPDFKNRPFNHQPCRTCLCILWRKWHKGLLVTLQAMYCITAFVILTQYQFSFWDRESRTTF